MRSVPDPTTLINKIKYFVSYMTIMWLSLTDVDECVVNNGGCSLNADCTNTPGSFICTCLGGYTGNGFTCSGIA